jgi:hypothetical protein
MTRPAGAIGPIPLLAIFDMRKHSVYRVPLTYTDFAKCPKCVRRRPVVAGRRFFGHSQRYRPDISRTLCRRTRGLHRTTPVAAVPGGWLEWQDVRLSPKNAIALKAERYSKYNTTGAEVDHSRPFQKLPIQCVTSACRMTPTIHQSSARVARPRQSELSRQVAVDFQPDADFDESRRCPGHRFLPFLGQYHHSPSSAYPGGLRIQEIKTIAFVYDPGSRLPASAQPIGIALPRRHPHPHDHAAWLAETLVRPCPPANPLRETSQRDRRIASDPRRGACRSIISIDGENAGNPLWVLEGRRSCPFHFSQRPFPISCLSSQSMAAIRPLECYLDANSPSARSAFFTSARPSELAKGPSCK